MPERSQTHEANLGEISSLKRVIKETPVCNITALEGHEAVESLAVNNSIQGETGLVRTARFPED